MKKQKLVQLLILLLTVSVLLNCAVSRRNQNLTPITTWEVNTGNLLSTMQDQYKTFFMEVGNAERNGVLTADQVKQLNDIGQSWKTTLESANSLYKTYVTTKDDGTKVQIISLIAKAEQIALTLATTVNQMKGVKP